MLAYTEPRASPFEQWQAYPLALSHQPAWSVPSVLPS